MKYKVKYQKKKKKYKKTISTYFIDPNQKTISS